MISSDVFNSISEWTKWASETGNQRFDIALMKIWVQFERFLGESFVNYAIGKASETGYLPTRKIAFQDDVQLNAFLRTENRTYIDYLPKIKTLHNHIFDASPFDAIFLDADNWRTYQDVFLIRNYVAHESGEAKAKLIKCIFGNNEGKYIEPNDYLKKKEKSSGKSFYTYYIENIKRMVKIIAEGIK